MPLLFLIAAIILFAGFFWLTWFEDRRGERFLAPLRVRIDESAERAKFLLEHVDFASFLREELSRLAHKLGHFFAHITLQAVRSVERLLTRLVRYLRARHEEIAPPRENVREFVRTLSDFKDGLKAAHPEIPEIK